MQSKSKKVGSFKWNKGVTLNFAALSNLESLGILSIVRYLCRKMIYSINYLKFWSCFENTDKCTFEESDEGYILKCFITNDTGYDIDYIDFVLTRMTKSQEYKMSSKIYDWRKNEKKELSFNITDYINGQEEGEPSFDVCSFEVYDLE